MKTDVILVSSRGNHIDTALEQAEKVAAYKGLSPKNTIHLRLLTEEMMGMMRSITGETEGKFWIEDEDDVYQLHLLVEVRLDYEKREKLIAASTSGVNEAAKGLMGKIRTFFDVSEDVGVSSAFFMPGGLEMTHDSIGWSMLDYRAALEERVASRDKSAEEAWDELENSVVSHVADDIKVNVKGRRAELIIIKKMA